MDDDLRLAPYADIGGNLSRFAVTHTDNELVIELGGELDAATVPPLWQAVDGSTRCVDGRCTVLDLSEVRFMDATGLGLVARLADRAGERGGTLVVRDPPDLVRRLLDATTVGAQVSVEPH
jgi:anti-anti-sigma factor